MGLSTYRSCTFAEKRAVLRTFWSRRVAESEKVERAAREYGPYAMVMVSIITVELAVIAAALFATGSPWSWLAGVAALASGISVLWTRDRQRAITMESA